MRSYSQESKEYVEDLKDRLSAASASNINDRKRFLNLYKLICSQPVLYCAYNEMRKKSSMAGIDGVCWDMIERQGAEVYIAKLAKDLQEKKYKPDQLLRVSLKKEAGGSRVIGIPTVRDRIVQKAITYIIGPICNERFIDSSWAYRPRRSAVDAVSSLIEKVKAGYGQMLSADIVKCFDNIDRDIVMENLQKEIADKELLNLISAFMEVSASTGKGIRVTASTGLHQGSSLSPLLSNVAMNSFDLWFYENVSDLYSAELIRYSDDFLVLAPQISPALEKKVTRYLESQGLSINGLEKEPKIINLRLGEPVSFLGYEIRMTRIKPLKLDVIPRVKNTERLLRNISSLIKIAETRSYTETEFTDKVNQNLRGFEGYYRLCNKQGVFDYINNQIETMLISSQYNNDSVKQQVMKI